MGVTVTIENDALLAEAVDRAGLGSQEATIEEALKQLIQNSDRREALQNLWGIGWEGDLDAMREGRADHSSK